MRICMLAYSFYSSDTRIMQYAAALIEQGHSVDVIALRREGAPAFEIVQGANVYRIQTRKINERERLQYLIRIIRFLFASAFFLTKKHLSKPYQVIHIHSVPDFLVFAALVPKLLGARVILDIHDILPEFYASKFGLQAGSPVFRLLVLVEKLSVAFSDHVIIANHLWQERLVARSARASKCTTFINYPDPRIFYSRPKAGPNGKFLITYPGTLNTHQGLDVAIRAFARIAGEMPNAEFHIYGEGPAKPSLLHLTDALGLPGRVVFHPLISVREVAEVMATTDLAVVPKRASSGFGNEAASTKIMEFMALGVPVIVSRTKIDTLYHDDTRVKFFESENESDLANSFLLLYRSPEIRKQLASNASDFVRRNNWEAKKQEYLNLVEALAAPLVQPQPSLFKSVKE
jgi:glycosyltransferase involved in cell wall biosynthesis